MGRDFPAGQGAFPCHMSVGQGKAMQYGGKVSVHPAFSGCEYRVQVPGEYLTSMTASWEAGRILYRKGIRTRCMIYMTAFSAAW